MRKVLFLFLNIILLTNAVTSKRDRTILYSKIAIVSLIYSSILYSNFLQKSVILYNSPLYCKSYTLFFNFLFFFLSSVILRLTEIILLIGFLFALFILSNYEIDSTKYNYRTNRTSRTETTFNYSVKPSSRVFRGQLVLFKCSAYNNNFPGFRTHGFFGEGKSQDLSLFNNTHNYMNYSTSNNNLNPNFVSGFIDAEGCFHISMTQNSKLKMGVAVRAIFQISLHKKDLVLLERIRDFFGVGTVSMRSDDAAVYTVSSLEDLQIILKHFENYPLILDKWADLELFKQARILMLKQEHLTMKGLNKIANIKASMNFQTLPKWLISLFRSIKPVQRPKKTNINIYHPYWIAGFVEGDGCFNISIVPYVKAKIGKKVGLRFSISQHARDIKLLNSFIDYLGCGSIVQHNKRSTIEFVVTKFSDIDIKIIPFFIKHSILGVKALDFNDWCEAAEIFRSKEHLTLEGINKLYAIKNGMNSNRVIP